MCIKNKSRVLHKRHPARSAGQKSTVREQTKESKFRWESLSSKQNLSLFSL